MESLKYYFKPVSYLLTFLMFLQSCTVYHSTPSSVEKAIASQNKVKVDVKTGEPYKFNRIKSDEDGVYGIVKIKSSTYKKLKERVIVPNEGAKYGHVKLSDLELQNIRLKNRTASTIITIAIPVVILGALVIWVVDESNQPTEPIPLI